MEEHRYPSPGAPPSLFPWADTPHSTPCASYDGRPAAGRVEPGVKTRLPRAWAMDDDEDDYETEEKDEVRSGITVVVWLVGVENLGVEFGETAFCSIVHARR